MRAQRSKIDRLIALACLLVSLPLHAQEVVGADPCLTDERCNSLYEAALNLSKAGQFVAALANYEDAYVRKPVPWLLINIGRVQQKMGKPRDAIDSYQRFLDSPAAQTDLELVVTAHQYKKQAQQDLAHPKQSRVIVMREERAPRPLWRILLGSGLLAGGMGMLVPGAYDLAVDGKCVSAPTPPALTCPTIYSGVPTGAPLVAVGALSIAGGILTLALPGRVFYRPITTISPSPAPPSSPPPPSSGDAPEPAPAPLLKPAPASGPPP
jgi:hypothetical protein